MANLKPGNLTSTQGDMSEFNGSMAADIEEELNLLLDLDDLPRLTSDPADGEVRARRRFMIAVARGVVRHLKNNPDAFHVTFDGTDHETEIRADQFP